MFKEIIVIIFFTFLIFSCIHAACFIKQLEKTTKRIEKTLERMEVDNYLYSLQNFQFNKEKINCDIDFCRV